MQPILSVMWSPFEKDLIISGGKDNCLRIWNLREHKPQSIEGKMS